jgi:cation diffusion facilitator family transporter
MHPYIISVGSSKKSIVASVVADVAIAAVKFVGGALTGSAVMVAEGIHSLLDGGSASLVLLGEHLSARPATRRHPFGHGKEVYFWTTVVAMLAFVVGGGFAVLEGVLALREREHRHLWINIVVLAAAFVFNAGSLWIAVRELKRYQRRKGYRGNLLRVIQQSHNPPIFVAVIADSAALVGLLIAFAGVSLSALTRSPVADAVASIADGAVMMLTGVLLGAEARGLVIGEGARSVLLRDARRIVAADEHVAAVDDVRSLQLGPDDVLLVLHARFAPGVRAAELPRVANALEARLRAQHPSIKHLVFDFGQASG